MVSALTPVSSWGRGLGPRVLGLGMLGLGPRAAQNQICFGFVRAFMDCLIEIVHGFLKHLGGKHPNTSMQSTMFS